MSAAPVLEDVPRFSALELDELLTRLAYAEGRADLLCLSMLHANGGNALCVSVSGLARELGIAPRTAAAQLRRSRELHYFRNHFGSSGSLVTLPAEEGLGAQMVLELAPRKVVESVDKSGDNPEIGCGAPSEGGEVERTPASRVLRTNQVDVEVDRKVCLPPEGQCSEQGADAGIDEDVVCLAVGLAEDFVTAGHKAPRAANLAELLLELERRLAPAVGPDDPGRPLELAAAVVAAAAGHAESQAVLDGGRGLRWGRLVAADPMRYGLRRTMLRSLALGWGVTAWSKASLDESDRRVLRLALEDWA